MNWRTGFDRLAWYSAGIAFLVIVGVITEDVWDEGDFAALTSFDWAVFTGSAIGGGVLAYLVVRGIGWVLSGFLANRTVSPTEPEQASAEIAESR